MQLSLDGAAVPMPFVLDGSLALREDTGLEGLLQRAEAAMTRSGSIEQTPAMVPLGSRFLERADAFADAGDFDTAARLYERWLASTPGDIKAWRRVADLYLAAERQEDAAGVYARVGDHYAEAGFLVLAIETYRIAAELVPYRGLYQRRLDALLTEHDLLTTGARRAVSAVQFTVTAPAYANTGETIAVELWAHRERDRVKVERRLVDWAALAPREPKHDPAITTRLHMDGLDVDATARELGWSQGLGVVGIDVSVPDNAASGSRSGVLSVYLQELQIARIHFGLQVTDVTSPPEVIPSREERHTRAMALFAPEDRSVVEGWVQRFEEGAPGVDVCLDSGEGPSDYLELLSSCDVLYLFWSPHALRSREMERKWRLALRARGLDFIDPIPLSEPAAAPAPAELAFLRGGDWRPTSRVEGRPSPDDGGRDRGPATEPFLP